MVWMMRALAAALLLAASLAVLPAQNRPAPPLDPAANARLLRLMAEHGDAQAADSLAIAYDHGDGVPQDYAQAARWYRVAAEKGSAPAQLSLAVMYQVGQGVPRDARQAAHWYRRAAEQNLAPAEASLAALYAAGSGVPRDARAAAHWYRRAARQGLADAQLNLALLEIDNPQVRDYADARHWLRLLAAGNALAARKLGDLYWQGLGTPRDRRRACRWYRQAARHDPAARPLAARCPD